MSSTRQTTEIMTKSDSWQMFNAISPKYDLLNRLLSLGMDQGWRGELKFYLPNRGDLHLLDLATGTADVLLALVKKSPKIETACGIDLAENMLALGRQKITRAGLDHRITLMKGDAEHIPYPDSTFDVVTIAFGIRNVESPQKVLKEIFRVLKKHGRALILEFSLSQEPLWRNLSLCYLRNVVPAVGGLISGNYRAYKYLNTTVETFPSGESFCELMEEAGFVLVQNHPLTFGIATVYQGDKL